MRIPDLKDWKNWLWTYLSYIGESHEIAVGMHHKRCRKMTCKRKKGVFLVFIHALQVCIQSDPRYKATHLGASRSDPR